MTERYTEGPEVFERPDPELEAIGNRLHDVSERLGFVESETAREQGGQLLREIKLAGKFNPDNPVHSDHFTDYKAALENSVASSDSAELVGAQLAQAELWLRADDVDRFYDMLYGEEDQPGDVGAIGSLVANGLENEAQEVRDVVQYLQSLNSD